MTIAIEIAGRQIGNGHPPFVIAEIGVNHNGDPELALRLLEAAADAGADAVKLQTFRSEALAMPDAPQAAYQRARARASSQLEMLRELELPTSAIGSLQARAAQQDIILFSSPFDLESVDLLASLKVPAFKIGSGDLTNLILLRAVAGHGVPVLLSTGMATISEIDLAMEDLRAHGNPSVALLQCVSVYPAAPAMINLRAMGTLRDRYNVPVGLSDHTTGLGTPVAAAALGAAIIEKHLTLDRSLPGPDHAASLDPMAFSQMVEAIHEAHEALGVGVKAPIAQESEVRVAVRRSLVLARGVAAGQPLSADDLIALRPEQGLSPLLIDAVVGRRAGRDLEMGDRLRGTDLRPPLETPDVG